METSRFTTFIPKMLQISVLKWPEIILEYTETIQTIFLLLFVESLPRQSWVQILIDFQYFSI